MKLKEYSAESIMDELKKQPGLVIDFVVAVSALLILSYRAGRCYEAASVIPENVRDIFFEK